jgi:D-glycero-D-manno-heptose 1,7-bisphosphate phosphatase
MTKVHLPDLNTKSRWTPKIVFLDRDGTINEEVNYLYKPEDLVILPGVPEALRELKEAGYLLILITNQAGIARGYYTEEDCIRLNLVLDTELKRAGAGLDAVYYCPHHPEHGIGKYKLHCHCRKPETGLLLQAEADLMSGRIPSGDMLYQSQCTLPEKKLKELSAWNQSLEGPDFTNCFMIGDKLGDILAGRRFGVRSILVGTGYGEKEQRAAAAGSYDYYADTLKEAAEWIIRQQSIR